MQHHETHSPSALPALDKCPCFKSAPAGRAAEEGTRQHQQLTDLYDGKEIDAAPGVKWAWQWVQENMDMHRTGNEVCLSLMRDFEEITFGTADFIGYDKLSALTVIDYKSGQERDYYYQLITYALAAMQKYGEQECRVVVLYGKIETVREFTILKEDAENAVFTLFDRLDGESTPTLCDYCGWCALNGECSATVPAIAAVVEQYPEEPIDTSEIVTFHASEITDPAQMAKVYEIACAVEKWAESAKHHAKQAAIEGMQIPGFRLRNGNKVRKIADTNIPAAFEATGLSREEFFSCCSVAVGKLEKAIAAKEGLKGKALKDEVNNRLADVIYLQENSPSLVRERKKG